MCYYTAYIEEKQPVQFLPKMAVFWSVDQEWGQFRVLRLHAMGHWFCLFCFVLPLVTRCRMLSAKTALLILIKSRTSLLMSWLSSVSFANIEKQTCKGRRVAQRGNAAFLPKQEMHVIIDWNKSKGQIIIIMLISLGIWDSSNISKLRITISEFIN